MTYDRSTGERLVAAAKPRFRDFRVDFEKISNAASRSARLGLDGLDPATAEAWFSDGDWHLKLPLQHRYADAGAWDAVAKFHAIRFKNYLGRNTPWPDAPAQATLDLMVDRGRADLALHLARTYVDMQHKRLKRDFSARNPRRSRVERSEGVEKAIAMVNGVIAAAISDRKAELLRDIDTLQPLIAGHGDDDDRAWMDGVRRELWMEKRA